ncbi:MAG TPA: VOC family protein [Microlunatus sp.]
MYLENLVFDASDPQRLGRFWQEAVGATMLIDEPDGYETRLSVDGGPTVDLCFQRVPEPATEPARLHLDLLGGRRQQEVVEQLVGLGARHADIGQGDVPWVVLADPEGNAFCVLEAREEHTGTGPIAAVPIDAADPVTDARFWSWLTGWALVPSESATALRHPSGRGLVLEFCPEPQPKTATKNRLHLDVRLERGDDPDGVAAGIVARGGLELPARWGVLPWRTFRDPSGNEFCLIPARAEPAS